MSIVTLAVAKEHGRIRGTFEDATVQLYLDAAEQDAMQFIQRAIYADEQERVAARAAAPTTLEEALAAIAVEREAADALQDCDVRATTISDLDESKGAAITAFRMAMSGIVITQAIAAAILLRFGHLYANRESVIAGDAAQAIEMPLGSQALLQPYRVRMGI